MNALHAEQRRARRRSAQRSSIGSSMASPTKTSASTAALAASLRTWREHAPICVWPPRQSICVISVVERARVDHPARGAAFVEAAEIDELHVEAADSAAACEHLALQLGRRDPRSAGGSWWRRARKSAGPRTGRGGRSEPLGFGQKGVDHRSGRSLSRRPAGLRLIEGLSCRTWEHRNAYDVGAPARRAIAKRSPDLPRWGRL